MSSVMVIEVMLAMNVEPFCAGRGVAVDNQRTAVRHLIVFGVLRVSGLSTKRSFPPTVVRKRRGPGLVGGVFSPRSARTRGFTPQRAPAPRAWEVGSDARGRRPRPG